MDGKMFEVTAEHIARGVRILPILRRSLRNLILERMKSLK